MVLSCPDGQNYAAIAKQMHETALEAEQRIYTLEQQLRAASNRPTLIQVSTTAVTGLISGIESYIARFGGASMTNTFNNTGMSANDSVDSNGTFALLGAGVYEIGLFASAVASGAVTDNSQRLFRIRQQRPDFTNLAGFTIVHEASILQFESNTGVGVDVCVVGTFKMQAGDNIRFTFFHDNVASNVNISIGTVVWLHRISDANVLAVI